MLQFVMFIIFIIDRALFCFQYLRFSIFDWTHRETDDPYAQVITNFEKVRYYADDDGFSSRPYRSPWAVVNAPWPKWSLTVEGRPGLSVR